MKRFYVALLIAMTAVVVASAQGDRARTKSGETSIDFTLNGFGDFGATGAYIGSTPPGNTLGDSLISMLSQLVGQRFIRPIFGAGMTVYVADNVALRLGLGANLVVNATPQDSGDDLTRTNLALGFSPAVEVHIVNTGPVSIYTGGVFSVATAFAWSGADDNRRQDTQVGYGGGAILGAQFYPWNNVSLGAETQFGIEITNSTLEIGDESSDGPTATHIGIMVPLRVSLSFHI
jgi:hypothetical protein